MILVVVQGAKGRLGSKIVLALKDSIEFEYAGSIDRNSDIPKCYVVISVAGADGTRALMSKLTNQRLLVGSTGDLPMEQIEEYSKKSAVMIAPNFSAGMGLLYEFINLLSKEKTDGFDASITDVHHVHKKDSPSGTALRMQSLLSEQNIDAAIQSERSEEVLGNHSFVLGNSLERITISHEVLSRDVYAQGCLKFVEELNALEAGLYIK